MSLTVPQAAAVAICLTNRIVPTRHARCRYCGVDRDELVRMLDEYGVAFDKAKGHVVVAQDVLNAEAEHRRISSAQRAAMLRTAQEPAAKPWYAEVAIEP